jgi:hypothetical protein
MSTNNNGVQVDACIQKDGVTSDWITGNQMEKLTIERVPLQHVRSFTTRTALLCTGATVVIVLQQQCIQITENQFLVFYK